MKPRLLDLFCGAGGCSVGYARAGFEVVGVDHKPQKNYPFAFIQGDALELARALLRSGGIEDSTGRVLMLSDFDAIHASPPCQAFTSMAAVNRKRWGHEPTAPKLIEPCRELLQKTCKPWVMENVIGSPLRDPYMLCGSMFGLGVKRHRLFETSFFFLCSLRCQHQGHDHRGIYGDHPNGGIIWKSRAGGVDVRRASSIEDGKERMGIDWMTWKELTQAIPPAYTEFIGKQLFGALE